MVVEVVVEWVVGQGAAAAPDWKITQMDAHATHAGNTARKRGGKIDPSEKRPESQAAAYTAIHLGRRAPIVDPTPERFVRVEPHRLQPSPRTGTSMKLSLSPSLLSMSFVAVVGCTAALPAAAQFAKPEDAIRYRKAGMTLLNAHFGRVAAMATGKVPYDAKVAADNAEIATIVSKLPFAGFVEGSDKGETRADPKIWSEMDKFKAAAAKMQDEMVKVNTAAKSGNLDALKLAVGETGKSCKACHDTYRKD